ncbi:MAG: TIGR01777 family oxidoreductase [Gemmatimonadaceae bacterium]|jgi:hypothetical protein|nr:TIGR01777 family oxidoreductase [Gemmatimonadaceae bacterium]
MPERTFSRELRVPVSVNVLWAWHERPGAFERLSPPWDRVRVVERSGGLTDGSRVVLDVWPGPSPVPTRWVMMHRDYRHGAQFRDVMQSGPFALWDHVHAMRADGANASVLTDTIRYALPLGALGDTAGGWYAASTLDRVFRYRHAVTAHDLTRHARVADRGPQRIAITGASGFIGRALSHFLTTGGHTVLRIGRGRVEPGNVDITWDPARGVLDPRALDGVDAVIHLAGASVAERWSGAHRRAILDSRVQGTALLARTLAQLEQKPRVLLSGSAIGIYGDRGDEVLTEDSTHGTGYLVDVARAWESATAPAEAAGIRTVHLRTGIVLGAAGGALAKQLPIYRLGGGGPIAGGAFWQSAIALDDEIGAIHHALFTESLRGPVNLVGPAPVTQAEFARTLGTVLSRPAIAPVPRFALELLFGAEMTREVLTSSQRVVPARLLASGFTFGHATLEAMLRFELGR